MRNLIKRLNIIEGTLIPVQQPRIIVLNAAESQDEALERLRLSRETLLHEEAVGRSVLWVRWAV